jgi:hypothetical protein
MGTKVLEKVIHHKHLLLLWLLWKQSSQAQEIHNNEDKERKNFDYLEYIFFFIWANQFMTYKYQPNANMHMHNQTM